jgi:ribosomal protein S18 acetylase RimI-like enzyme
VNLTTASGLVLSVREPTPADSIYAVGAMLKTVRSAPSHRDMPARRWAAMADLARSLWEHIAPVRLVATLPDDEFLIVGFAMGDPSAPRIDYLHVRGGFRGQGVASALAAELGVRPGVPAAITLDTWDLSRPEPGTSFPVGLLRNPRWSLRLVPPEL